METEGLSPAQQIRLDNIVALFQSLDKLVRGMKLYEGKGPLVERLFDTLSQKTADSLESGEFTLSITPIGPTYLGEAVLEDGKPPSYLFQMYCDGIRELTFVPGVPDDELKNLVEVLFTEIKDPNEDIVTMMWKQSFGHIRYYAVDTLGIQVGDDDNVKLKAKSADQLKSSEFGEKMKMSSSDIRLLRSNDQLLWMRESRSPVKAPENLNPFIEKLQNACQSEQDVKRFIAIAIRCAETDATQNYSMLQHLVDGWIKSGDSDSLLSVFRILLEFAHRKLNSARALLSEMVTEEKIVMYREFIQSKPVEWSDQVESLLTLEGLPHENWVLVLKDMPLGESRANLQTVLKVANIDMTELYLDSLESEEEGVVLDAVSALGEIGSPDAIKGILKMLSSVLASVRHAALSSIKGRYDETMRVKILKILRDPEPSNRLLALKVLTEGKERQIGNGILGVMQNPDFQNYQTNEQQQFFMALAQYPSPTVFQYLDQILSEKNLTRSKKIIERQQFAVQCLGKMKSTDAKNVLSKASARWYLSGEIKKEINKRI